MKFFVSQLPRIKHSGQWPPCCHGFGADLFWSKKDKNFIILRCAQVLDGIFDFDTVIRNDTEYNGYQRSAFYVFLILQTLASCLRFDKVFML